MSSYVCIVSCDVPPKALDVLRKSFTVITLPPDKSIAQPVSSHPDMILSFISDKTILPYTYNKTYPEISRQIESLCGFDTVLARGDRGKEYPFDVSLNAAIGKNFVVCRKKSTAKEIIDTAIAEGYDIINVNQGYSACSCIITPKGIITSDPSIYKELISHNINAVFVSNQGIYLPGYDVGFIGGCGGFCTDTLYFFGNIESFSGYRVIKTFADECGYSIVSLPCDTLTDYGGIKFIRNKSV